METSGTGCVCESRIQHACRAPSLAAAESVQSCSCELLARHQTCRCYLPVCRHPALLVWLTDVSSEWYLLVDFF